MENPTALFTGIDTAKVCCDVAYILDDRQRKPQYLCKVKSTKQGIEKMVKHLQSRFTQQHSTSFMWPALASTGSIA